MLLLVLIFLIDDDIDAAVGVADVVDVTVLVVVVAAVVV
mgnify:CR=1 FL=1